MLRPLPQRGEGTNGHTRSEMPAQLVGVRPDPFLVLIVLIALLRGLLQDGAEGQVPRRIGGSGIECLSMRAPITKKSI